MRKRTLLITLVAVVSIFILAALAFGGPRGSSRGWGWGWGPGSCPGYQSFMQQTPQQERYQRGPRGDQRRTPGFQNRDGYGSQYRYGPGPDFLPSREHPPR